MYVIKVYNPFISGEEVLYGPYTSQEEAQREGKTLEPRITWTVLKVHQWTPYTATIPESVAKANIAIRAKKRLDSR